MTRTARASTSPGSSPRSGTPGSARSGTCCTPGSPVRSLAASRAVLAPHLGYVQVKDVASAEDLTPLPLGSGVLPLAEGLDGTGPDTWVCWEYEKRWHPGAAELPGLLAAGREYLLRLGAPKQ